MNREAVYLGAAALLPLFNRFQEVSVTRGASVEYRYAIYGQVPVSIVCLVACCLLLVRINHQVRKQGGSLRRALPLRYCLFALPVFLGYWRVASSGDANTVTKITTGLGGPYAWLLFAAAGFTFVCVEGCFRQATNLKCDPGPQKSPDQASLPTPSGAAGL